MFALSVLLVIISGMSHAVWNLYAKRSPHKSLFIWIISVPSAIVVLPRLIGEITAATLPLRAFIFVGLALLFQAGYAILLSKTYEMGDLSQVYPLMRGTGTLLIPIIGVVFLGETLSIAGWLGIISIIAGFFSLSGWPMKGGVNRISLKLVLLALSVGLCITCYVIVDKINLAYFSPYSLLGIDNIGGIIGLAPSVIASKGLKNEIKEHGKTLLLGSVLSPGSYLLFLFAMSLAPIAHISPIREVGTVFAVILGIFVLKEKKEMRRVIASLLIVAGIFAIGFFG